MNFSKICVLVALTILLWSCSTSKTIPYFQDLRPGESELTVSVPSDIRIKPKDKLNILVSCQDQRLSSMFNLLVNNQQVGGGVPPPGAHQTDRTAACRAILSTLMATSTSLC